MFLWLYSGSARHMLMALPCFRLSRAKAYSALLCAFVSGNSGAAEEIQFNTDVLDIKERQNVDLSQFSRAGYIPPGQYSMNIMVNKQDLPEQSLSFVAPPDDPKGSIACLSPEVVSMIGLKEDAASKLTWWNNGSCLNFSSLPGLEARGDLSTGTLYLNVPQAWLLYTARDWDPPARWDEGIPGLLFDYNLNADARRDENADENLMSLTGNGTAGANFGPWRLRADWQSRLEHSDDDSRETQNSWDWSRYYMYRALPSISSQLTVGEDYLRTDLFDSFRFAGVSLESDDSMLPPSLRGYAPEVSGVARTNAKVVISQMGRIIREEQVAAGPFRIQDLSDTVSGKLDVRVEEQDGSVQSFQQDTATVPYLTRPGRVRYKLATGKPSDIDHHTDGPYFGTGEFSWGVNSGWSLLGGAIASEDYTALNVGIGRDLFMFGALSFDVTHSRASVDDDTLQGNSYRLNYSKDFNEINGQISFAAYRFSEREFMSMSEFLQTREHNVPVYNSKELYTVNLSKQFPDWNLSASMNYSVQTYWDREQTDYYNLTVSHYFDIGDFRNLSLSLSAYRQNYEDNEDDGMYLSLSMPWGTQGSSVSYNASVQNGDNAHSATYFGRVDEHNNYQLTAGLTRQGENAGAYYTHQGSVAEVNASAGYQSGSYSAVGASLRGGATLTPEGGALHRSSIMGGTRLLIDTDGVPGVPVKGYGASTRSNLFGKAVLSDVNSYYRNRASVDLQELDDNTEVTQSIAQLTLTEGAIGYRKFGVISGAKAMAVVRLKDGSWPPFGATVINAKGQETGIVNDEGNVFLSGINGNDKMTVRWNGEDQCAVSMPGTLPAEFSSSLLLTCTPVR
jgi:outer membrane usher protein FimD/PapC